MIEPNRHGRAWNKIRQQRPLLCWKICLNGLQNAATYIRQFPRNAAGHTRAIKEVIIVDIADTMRAVSLVISRCTEGYAYF